MKHLLVFGLLGMSFSPSSAQTSTGAEAANRHAFEMFQLFRQMTKGNFCFSPYSGHRIAAMLAEGARGETQKQLLSLAHLPDDAETRLRQADGLRQELSGGKGLLLDITNSLWMPAGAPVEPAFVTIAKDRFGASVESLPGDDPVGSAMKVNEWIRSRTRGRITSMVGPSVFQVPGSLLAVNTVFLKASWAHQFELQRTRVREFTLPGESRIHLPMMMQKHAMLHAEQQNWQLLEMSLSALDAEWSMIFLLPRRESLRADIEKGLSQESLNAMMKLQESIDVNLLLPRFGFSTSLDLKGLWQTLGARRAFDAASVDFSGMVSGPYKLGAVLHEVTIEVNETGAEAAAVTIAPADPFGEAPPEVKPKRQAVSFVADHPFVWLIQHRRTGLILFMGRFAGQ
jgi:serpin B